MPYQATFELVESWEPDKINQAIKAAKGDAALAAELKRRYEPLYGAALGKKSLRALANLPEKWEKMKADKRALVIEYFPADRPFFTDDIDLSGERHVNQWRESRFTGQIGAFPLNLLNFKSIRVLRLNHQQLEQLPENIGELANMEVLELKDNNLKALPQTVAQLQNLRVLNLGHNFGLEDAPDFGEFVHLEEIDLEYTKVATLSQRFFQLKNLKSIKLDNCALEKDIAAICAIQKEFPDARLSISYGISRVLRKMAKEGSGNFKGQESIKVSDIIPAELFEADVVKDLEIDCFDAVKVLPDRFDELQTVEKLRFKFGNVPKALAPSVFRMKNLKELYLERTLVDTLPENMGDASQLEVLELNAWVAELPESFRELRGLKTLKINSGPLKSLAVHIAGLTELERLEIGGIGATPDGRCPLDVPLHDLKSLKTVRIETNGRFDDELIANLPASIETLELTARGGESALSLGKLLNHLPNLQKLHISNNGRGTFDLSEQTPIEPHHHLTELMFRSPSLKRLPPGAANLKALSEVTLFSVGLEELDGFYDCSELTSLRISEPLFDTLPDGIERLEKLEKLGFENSNIQELPDAAGELKSLKRLCMDKISTAYKTKIKKQIKGLNVVKSWYT